MMIEDFAKLTQAIQVHFQRQILNDSLSTAILSVDSQGVNEVVVCPVCISAHILSG